MSRHYLYRHIRKDSEIPFYIGIGTKKNKNHYTHESEYSRGYSKTKRSSFWKNIVNQTEYEVEILMESDDYEFIKQKEIEFIALHGRRDLGKGTLVNLTDGGDGNLGWIPSEEAKQKIREANTGKFASEETKLKQSIARKGIKYTEARRDIQRKCMLKDENHPGARLLLSTQTGIFYYTVKEASKVYGITKNHLSLMLTGVLRNKTDLIYAESENDGIHPIIPQNKPYSPYIYTEEDRNRVSERFTGRWLGGKSLNAKKVINVKTGIIYDCIKNASETSCYSYANFRAMLNPNNNRRNTTDYEYYDEQAHSHLIKN